MTPNRNETTIIEPQRRRGAKTSVLKMSRSCALSKPTQVKKFFLPEVHEHYVSIFFFAPLRLCGSNLLGVLDTLAVQTLVPTDHV